jgi:hypothetical protein
MRVSPSGATEATRSRNFARVSVVKRFDVVGMTMTHAADGDAGDEVDVLVAVLVDQRAVDAARHREAGVEGKALGARRQVTALLGDDLLRAGSDFTTLSQRRPPENRRAR